MKLEGYNWESKQSHFCSPDLEILQVLERKRVLEVLRRDKALRTIEAERIRRLRAELHDICRQGTRSVTLPSGQRSCARCQRVLGQFLDCGSVCCGCSHRVCSRCRVVRSARSWRCTVCDAYRDFKIKSGEWFQEQQAKKFPEEDRHETTGEKILQSNRGLSFITVVPATPPPFHDASVRSCFNRSEELKKSKPFTKSMENLMVSVSTHIKKLSKSQNDLSVDAGQLTVGHALAQNPAWKSQSESAIHRACDLCKAPSLPDLSQSSRGMDHSSASTICLTDDNMSHTSEHSDEHRDSNGRAVMDSCGTFKNTGVTGEIEVAIGYNHKTSCLKITIKACRDLMFGEKKKKKCHPYVKICVLPKTHQSQKMKTTVKRQNNPVYNETFTCVLVHELWGSSALQISVWHSRGLKRKVFLGETVIRLTDWSLERSDAQNSVWYSLAPKQEHPLGGDVELYSPELLFKARFQFLPQTSSQTNPHTDDTSSGELVVLLSDVSQLLSGSQTSYMKGILCLPGDRELVQRTPALKKRAGTLQMTFSRFTHQELQQATLLLSLWEKSSFSHSERLLRSAQLSGGESSWQRLQQMPDMWHDFIVPLHADGSINTRHCCCA